MGNEGGKKSPVSAIFTLFSTSVKLYEIELGQNETWFFLGCITEENILKTQQLPLPLPPSKKEEKVDSTMVLPDVTWNIDGKTESGGTIDLPGKYKTSE